MYVSWSRIVMWDAGLGEVHDHSPFLSTPPSRSSPQALRTPANILVVNLALSDLIMLTTNVPFFTYNCFSGGIWMFSAAYCEIYACLGEYSTTPVLIHLNHYHPPHPTLYAT